MTLQTYASASSRHRGVPTGTVAADDSVSGVVPV